MKRRWLAWLLSVLLLLSVLAGCSDDHKTAEGMTKGSLAETAVTEPATEVETEFPGYIGMDIKTSASISMDEFGLRASTFTTSDPYVADFDLYVGVIRIYVYNSGVTDVRLKDCFGHTASFTVSVTEDYEVTMDVTPCAESFLEVSQFGAKRNGTTDDSAAFQAAIDAAKPGETVYVYPGIYKLSYLQMREGVTVKMYTTMTDAAEGYTEEIARAVSAGQMTVLKGVRFMNNAKDEKGAEGCSNFTVSGGVLDMDGTTFGAVIFGCADNARLENIIFKDIKGNHAIQLTGCTNTSIVNCMFAGYVLGDTFTREVVQVEPSTPGATGTATTAPLRFANGEYYYPENITVDRCYFGKSDEAGAPLMAIGHHSQVGRVANVTGFKITNNVFDECLYAAIRYDNLADVEISGNTFISTSKYKNETGFSEATTPAFIILYHHNGRSSYNNVVDGTNVTSGEKQEQAGIHNLKIENNTFTVGKGSDKMVLYYANTLSYKPGASYSASALRLQETYDSTPYYYVGYVVTNNYGKNVSFVNNTINIEGQPTYSNYFMYVRGVYNFEFRGNKCSLADGVAFSSSYKTIAGLDFDELYSDEDARTYAIDVKKADQAIIFRVDGEVISTVKTYASVTLTLKARTGGDLELSTDRDGNLYVDIVSETGYSFAWIKKNGVDIGENASVFAETTYDIAFAR